MVVPSIRAGEIFWSRNNHFNVYYEILLWDISQSLILSQTMASGFFLYFSFLQLNEDSWPDAPGPSSKFVLCFKQCVPLPFNCYTLLAKYATFYPIYHKYYYLLGLYLLIKFMCFLISHKVTLAGVLIKPRVKTVYING